MKPNVVTTKTKAKPVGSPLTPVSTAKIVSLSRPKMEIKEKETEEPTLAPPDEETLKRLNILAKQHPFCTVHRGSNSPLL
jgi:hypothetical protein